MSKHSNKGKETNSSLVYNNIMCYACVLLNSVDHDLHAHVKFKIKVYTFRHFV